MDVTIHPSSLGGAIRAVASKSMAHRLLILAALAPTACTLRCSTSSADIEATASCLVALGLRDARHPGAAPLEGATQASASPADKATLDCGESGSTLRFMLPVVGALGREVRMLRRGRLSQRPMLPFTEQLERHGMHVAEDGDALEVSGALRGGTFVLPGDVSSQYASGLLMAAPFLGVDGPFELRLRQPVQSRPYLDLTLHALEQFGVSFAHAKEASHEVFRLDQAANTASWQANVPSELEVEGDWSNAAFWLAAGALEREGLTVFGLDLASPQGDRAILAALATLGARIARKGDAARATADRPRAARINVGAIPDLVPPLAAVCATTPGTSVFCNAGRLRLKESDRLASISGAINALGGKARVDGDDLVVEGVDHLAGGVVDTHNDHRIAMMAAVMATHAAGEITIRQAECVAKSYPGFFEDYERLGGITTREGA